MQNVNHEVRNANENFNLAESYMFGTGVPKDEQEAVRLYGLAAAQGLAFAQNNLGYCYENGIGVAKDKQEAVRLYGLAAAQGHAAAQFNLGWCYRKGTGVPKDEQEAVRLYGLAAAQGLAFAQNNLGYCYGNGIGVPKDEQEAVRLYGLAAAQGLAFAQNNLGYCYGNGIGVAKDKQEAVRLYGLAAAQGHAAAQFNLGWCYRKGTGVPKDEQEAVRLYGLAAAQGLAKEAHCGHGNALLALNCPTEALASFDAALEIDSRYSEARDGRDRALKTKKKWDNWRASRTQDTKTSNPEIELTAWPKKEETRDQKDQRGATDMANLGNCGLDNVNFFAPSRHLVVGTVPGDSVAENKAQSPSSPSAGC